MQVLVFLNCPKDLDLSYKMNLDFGDNFKMEEPCIITEEIQYMKISAESNNYLLACLYKYTAEL